MSDISYRSYQPGDEAAIIELWNRCLPIDPLTRKRFRHQVLLDANFDPEGLNVAFDGEKLIGCLYTIRRLSPMQGTDLEEENGWMPFFFVSPEYEKSGVGSAMLQRAKQFLIKNGRKQLFFASYAPNYFVPGIDEEVYPKAYAFLQKQGFQKLYSPIAMDRSLVYYSIADDAKKTKQQREKEGYVFRFAEDRDLYEVIQFANDKFNPDWGRAIRDGILQGLPLMERLMITRNPKGEVVGFAVYGAYEGIPERFGPFGVDETERGKGLGKIILADILHQMKSEGLHGAWFLWTGEKTAAGHLYKKLGFHKTRKFHVMKQDLMEER